MIDPVMGLLTLLSLVRDERGGGGGGGGGEGPPGPPGPPGDPGDPSSPPSVAPSVPAPGAAPGPVVPVVPPVLVVPPGGGPPMPAWPSAPVPATLPPFPGPGWCPDTPVTPAVSARASYWNAQLWDYASKAPRRAFVQESLGGQWVTFAAAWHPDATGNPRALMATEAWRVCTAPPVAPSAPHPAAGAVEQAAHAMNVALLEHGYKQADQPLYRAFQTAAGLGADGFPGAGTMGRLQATLSAMGEPMAPVHVYPWKATGAYDGKNAPTQAEWSGAAAGPPAGPSPSPGMPGAVLPYPGKGAWQNNGAYITRYQVALTWLAHVSGHAAVDPGGVDGRFGPKTAAAVKAFQASVTPPLTPDGQMGPETAKTLDEAVASYSPSAAA